MIVALAPLLALLALKGCASNVVPRELAPTSANQSGYVSARDFWSKLDSLRAFALSEQPSFSFERARQTVLPWITDAEQVQKLGRAVRRGDYIPGKGLLCPQVWAVALMFADGSIAWVELTKVSRDSNGYLCILGDGYGYFELDPSMRAVLDEAYGWDRLEAALTAALPY